MPKKQQPPNPGPACPHDGPAPLGDLVNHDLAMALEGHGRSGRSWASVLESQPLRRFSSQDRPAAEPAAPRGAPEPGERRHACIVADPAQVAEVLVNAKSFSSVPYAALGGGRFMLALDPAPAQGREGGEHTRQRTYVVELLQQSPEQELRRLAKAAVAQAAVAGLQQHRFDLAELSEHIAARFCMLWFGFGIQDLLLIQKVAAGGYLALVQQIVGRHFMPVQGELSTEAAAALDRLGKRTGELLLDYFRIEAQRPSATRDAAAPDTPDAPRDAGVWPKGVASPANIGFPSDWAPLLKRMAGAPGDFSISELVTIVLGLLVGTVGNVQASVCLVMRQILSGEDEGLALKEAVEKAVETAAKTAEENERDVQALQRLVAQALARTPPVPFIPRRANCKTKIGDSEIDADTEVLLWLGPAAGSPAGSAGEAQATAQVRQKADAPAVAADETRPFGAAVRKKARSTAQAPHACPGKDAALVLVTEAVRMLARLPSLAQALDPDTGKAIGLKQRWGFACESYPLTYERMSRVLQQPLIVIMPIKSPVAEHAEKLARIISLGAPRIEQALRESRIVHFAWFEFLDQGRQLALRTVYDFRFRDYLEYFALRVGDLFDQLFEHLEGAPPLPVSQNVDAFIEVIRARNGTPAQGYFFSAYPQARTSQIVDKFKEPT